MKVISVFLSIFLVFPIAFFLLNIFSLYNSKGPLKYFGVDSDLIFELARPYIVWLVIYVAAFAISIYLNIKGKYKANIVFLGAMIVIYMFIPYFLKHI